MDTPASKLEVSARLSSNQPYWFQIWPTCRAREVSDGLRSRRSDGSGAIGISARSSRSLRNDDSASVSSVASELRSRSSSGTPTSAARASCIKRFSSAVMPVKAARLGPVYNSERCCVRSVRVNSLVLSIRPQLPISSRFETRWKALITSWLVGVAGSSISVGGCSTTVGAWLHASQNSLKAK